MLLNEQQICAMTRGAARMELENGYYRFYRFTKAEQATYVNHPRNSSFYNATLQMAAIRWAFTTDAEFLAFDFFNDRQLIRTSLDVYENGALQRTVTVDCQYLQEGHLHIPLSKGEKLVEIYFPYCSYLGVANVSLNDGASFAPHHRRFKMLTYGDSITHGGGATHPSFSYAPRLAALLDADIISKAVAGEHFYPPVVCEKTPEDPDWITVAYGTNDWKHCTKEEFDQNCTAVLQKLTEFYPNAPIILISPSWRSDFRLETPFGEPATGIYAQICKNAEAFPNATVIDGWNLIPHRTDFFADNRLHPNDMGFGVYTANLYRAILPHLIKRIPDLLS